MLSESDAKVIKNGVGSIVSSANMVYAMVRVLEAKADSGSDDVDAMVADLVSLKRALGAMYSNRERLADHIEAIRRRSTSQQENVACDEPITALPQPDPSEPEIGYWRANSRDLMAIVRGCRLMHVSRERVKELSDVELEAWKARVIEGQTDQSRREWLATLNARTNRDLQAEIALAMDVGQLSPDEIESARARLAARA